MIRLVSDHTVRQGTGNTDLISHSLQSVRATARLPQGCLQPLLAVVKGLLLHQGLWASGKVHRFDSLPKGPKTMLERQMLVKCDLKKVGRVTTNNKDPQKSEKGEVIRSRRPVRLSSLEGLVGRYGLGRRGVGHPGGDYCPGRGKERMLFFLMKDQSD